MYIANDDACVNTKSAEIIPFDNPAEQDYVDAIRQWCCDRNLSDVLKPKEIGAMRAFDRIDAQRKAIILGLSDYYRKHPRSDVAPGVAVITALLCDNEDGLARVTQPTLAQLFGRSRSAIGDAQKRLKDDGIIGLTRGRYAGSYPIIPRVFTEKYNHMRWLIKAINMENKPLNLPAPPADCQSTGPTGGLSQSTDRTGGLENFNQPVEGNSINRPDATHIHYKTSLTVVDKAAKVVSSGIATAIAALPAAAQPAEPPAIIQPARLSSKELADKLFEAAGSAMNMTIPTIEVMTIPKLWLDSGCSLEDDILPTIRALAKRKAPGSISGWKYFTQAIADAKANRTMPMPVGNVSGSKSTVPKSREQAANDAWFEKEFAACQQKGLIS